MDVSIIIVTYNTRVLTSNCIDSIIQNTTGVSYEIILVDNASVDGSKQLFEKDNRITYIYNTVNVGFGRANNIGYKVAKGKYIFLLNSDTILQNNSVKIFRDAMDHMPSNVACIGSQLLNGDGLPTKSFGPFFSFNVIIPKHVNQIIDYKIPDDGVPVDVIIGADMFIKKEVADIYGLFDPVFFMYQEENDMQRRYAAHGYISKIIEGPKIVHLEGKSNKHTINVRMIGGAYTYMKKWYPLWKYYLFRLLYSITRTPKIFMNECDFNEKIRFLKVLYFYKADRSKMKMN
ncbi:MAG: glycosyltransferase family 2 protein [Prevotella sp.]|nr:glycosyltransferase family 2 protein [Prevotella sp.]